MIWMLILLPVIAGLLAWMTKNSKVMSLLIAIAMSGAEIVFAFMVYQNGLVASMPVEVLDFTFVFKSCGVSAMFLLFTSLVFPLVAVYTAGSVSGKPWGGQYQFWQYLTLAMVNGALLADHMELLLFFWEGLLCALFGMLVLRNSEHPRAAAKALTLAGAADIIMMLGIVATIYAAETGIISEMNNIPLTGVGMLGFVCLMLGALGKAGAMPFHSWIPMASEDAPTPFMMLFPGTMQTVLGVYLASRVVTRMYDFAPGTSMSTFIMVIGALTLFGGAAMALIQKDMKKLIAYLAVSQTGYIALGLGTGLDMGTVGGVFHALGSIICVTGLFMVAGAVEKQAGTTDLTKISGLKSKMPLAFVCAVIFALTVAGFPITSGFWSRELILNAALKANIVYYIVALAGVFISGLALLKLIRAAFFGEVKTQPGESKKSPLYMTLPIAVLALAGLVFGVWNPLPLDELIGKAYNLKETFSGMPQSWIIAAVTCAVLAIAALDHNYGFSKTGKAVAASEHITKAPVAKQLYTIANKGILDPYNWLSKFMEAFASVCRGIEDLVTWIYDKGIPGFVDAIGSALSRFDNGSLSRYLLLTLFGAMLVVLIFAAQLV